MNTWNSSWNIHHNIIFFLMSAAAILNFCIFGKILKVHHWTANGFTLSAPKIIQNQWKTYFILWNQRRTLSFLDCRMLFSNFETGHQNSIREQAETVEPYQYLPGLSLSTICSLVCSKSSVRETSGRGWMFHVLCCLQNDWAAMNRERSGRW